MNTTPTATDLQNVRFWICYGADRLATLMEAEPDGPAKRNANVCLAAAKCNVRQNDFHGAGRQVLRAIAYLTGFGSKDYEIVFRGIYGTDAAVILVA